MSKIKKAAVVGFFLFVFWLAEVGTYHLLSGK